MNPGIKLPVPDRRQQWAIGAICAITGLGAGALAATVNPLFLLPLIPLFGGAIWAMRSPERAVWLMIAGIALLPRVASPVSIGFKPTIVDAALVLFLGAWGIDRARTNTRGRGSGVPAGVGGPLLGLVFVAVAAFVAGIPNGPLTTLVIRRFTELLLTLLSVFVLARVFAAPQARALAVRAFLIFGALAALIGIALYAIPDDLAMRLLSSLRPFGYPEGAGVLRYVRDDPALLQRATGLWIDPNAFGGFLLVTGSIGLAQVFAERPVWPRAVVVACMSAMGLALVLTVSRGAMVGLALVALVMGVLKYRRMLPLIAGVIVVALILPQTRELIAHFADGFAGRDLATQMRVGEYKDAFRLIERYPVFGVGFADTPDVDLYIGVSNMYLLIAQQMGLVGLAVFVTIVIGLVSTASRAIRPALAAPANAAISQDVAVWLGAHGAVGGALLSGVFDHYFFNIDFHNSVMLFWIVVALALASSTTIIHHDAVKSQSSQEDRHRVGRRPDGQRDGAGI